jgi:signal transduction histidine kinase
VKDSGPGIAPEDIPLLFEKFVRLQRDLSGPIRGTGLGLYISKHLVEAMGGRIWVESSGIAGQGSRFSFLLPCVAHVPQFQEDRKRRTNVDRF